MSPEDRRGEGPGGGHAQGAGLPGRPQRQGQEGDPQPQAEARRDQPRAEGNVHVDV